MHSDRIAGTGADKGKKLSHAKNPSHAKEKPIPFSLPFLRALLRRRHLPSPFLMSKIPEAPMFRSKKRASVPPLPEDGKTFVMPSEDGVRHEATWLQWPHNFGWDKHHVKRLEPIWIQLTLSLHKDEKVYIIVYNESEKERIDTLLKSHHVDMSQIAFYVWPTDDVWIRDSGPIFVFDEKGKLAVTDWQFNGWGGKAKYRKCNQIPAKVASQLGVPVYSIPMVNE